MPNDLLVTTTDILRIEVAKDYSGASGIYVDNVNNIISITGDVGKEYSGVNPIVVNNEENLISANSAPIGVQEPLYFVQDDDDAVIIGLSGEYLTPIDVSGKLDTSAFESWQQGQYTNDLTALNQKINDVSASVPSIEGLATEQLVEETSAAIVSQIPSTAGLASETYVQEQVSGKASKSELETVSGDIVNLIPDTSNFITNVSAEETYQPAGDYLSSNALEGYATENWVTAQGYLTGVDLSNFYTKDETSGAEQLAEAFSNIPGGDTEVNELVRSNSGTWNGVTNKLDTTAFSDVSGSFLTAHQDLSNYYTKDETSGKEELAQAFADIPVGDPEVNAYVTNNSAAIDGTVNAVQTNSGVWNDITAYQSNSGSYLTAHQSLEGYATTAWVDEQGYLTAHQDISNKLDVSSFSDVSGTFLTAVNIPESADWQEATTTYQANSGTYATNDNFGVADLEGWITGYNGSSFFAAGARTAAFDKDGHLIDTYYYTTAAANSMSSMFSAAIDYVSANAGDEFPVSADEAIQYVQSNSANIDDTVNNVQTNSGVWGGEALPISSRDGIDLEIDNGTLYIGASALTGAINAYEQNSASYLVENNFEYDGNNLITAYNGSALSVVNPLPYPIEFVATSAAATGTNILYVVTGSNQ